MVKGLWGKKIGMTQIFVQNKAVPVTAIDIADWYVTAVKTQDRDGYDAIQMGRVKDKFAQEAFSNEWLSKPKRYFQTLKEVCLDAPAVDTQVGSLVDVATIISEGDKVDIAGHTRGRGFQGVVKRWRFAGGGGSHGSKTGRRPGSIGHITACGKVIKGKKMPGHMGNKRRMTLNLEVMKIMPDERVILVKGAVPGHSGSVVFVRKSIR